MITNVVFLFLFCVLIRVSNQTLQEDISEQLNKSNRAGQTLLRRRRYLTFPEGSSLQLVYCLTIPSVGVGEIFTFGATAALAWELPSEPEDLLLKHLKKITTEPPTTTPRRRGCRGHLALEDLSYPPSPPPKPFRPLKCLANIFPRRRPSLRDEIPEKEGIDFNTM